MPAIKEETIDMLKESLVTVVITCYNYASYIEGCINSILDQRYKDFEIVVVNDGSTDNTDEVISGFLSNPRIKYIKQSNAGQANAKNTGIKHSEGKYIAFLDADDLWDETKLEKQIPLFENPRVGVVFSKARYIDENGNELEFELSGEYLIPRSGRVSNYLIFDNFVPFSSSVVRRECFEKVGFFDESLKMGIDWDLWLRISVYYEFDFVDEPLLIYRIGHSGQMSKNLEVRLQCSDKIMERFIKENKKLFSASLVRKALHYSYCNRGNFYWSLDAKRSLYFFLRAVCTWPFSISPYLGLARSFLKRRLKLPKAPFQ